MRITPISADTLDHDRRGYPRPQLQRTPWYSLNGEWEFAIDTDGTWASPSDVDWGERIRVPFAPEAPASGVGRTDYFRACWYRLRVALPDRTPAERWVLHFGAVDYSATVWIESAYAAAHEGGNTPFSIDITDWIAGSSCEIVVRAEDDPHDLAKPRGKQDWQLDPHSIWYPRTTGIWQTVWLEKVPATWIGQVRWVACLERWELGLEVRLAGARHEGLRVQVRLSVDDVPLADDTYA